LEAFAQDTSTFSRSDNDHEFEHDIIETGGYAWKPGQYVRHVPNKVVLSPSKLRPA
jgi:hypothetical protein